MPASGRGLLKKLYQVRSHLTQTQFIAYGFLGMILMGSLLLMLPISSRTREASSFLNCLFTATSASCVTGLVVYDTWSHWSLFGQLVVLTMIQIGGLRVGAYCGFSSLLLPRKNRVKKRSD